MGSVPRSHGNAVVQSPVLETKLRPIGCGSSPPGALASEGRGFVTVRVNARVEPAVTLAGPLFAIRTSAEVSIAVVSVALLFASKGSGVSAGGVTLAVLL